MDRGNDAGGIHPDGVVTAISMTNGKVLDIKPISRACKAFLLKETLKLNNGGNMEPVGGKRIWERSEAKHKLRYIEFYGDGDTKSFTTVQDT